MKRWLAIVLCVLFAVSTLSLVACQKKQEPASDAGGYGSNEEAAGGYGGGEEAAGGYGDTEKAGGEEAGGYGGGEEEAGGYGK